VALPPIVIGTSMLADYYLIYLAWPERRGRAACASLGFTVFLEAGSRRPRWAWCWLAGYEYHSVLAGL
jgi:hypothetical protein